MAPRKTKRETSESEEDDTTPPPPPPKKVRKGSHKVNENDESDGEQQSTKIPNISFIGFIHDLDQYAKDKLHKLKGKPDIAKIADGIPMLNKYHALYTQPTFMSDFNALYVTAARRKNIALDNVVAVMNRYLNDGATVEDFPGFPKAPSRPINAYISENRDVDHASLEDIVKLRKEFASGSIDTKPYFDQYAEECKVYIDKVKKYLETHGSELQESHIAHVNSIVTKTFKSINAKPSSSSQKKIKKEKKTAFQWYKDANPELYADKDEETRDRKLQRKFDKLDEAEKRMFENIAAKNS